MKTRLWVIPAAIFCTAVSAQMPGAMNEQDMQKMMAALQDVQACFQQIDQKEVATLQQQSEEFTAAIKTLCKKGERDEAQAFARDFYSAMIANKTVKQAKSCAQKIPEAVKQMVQTPMDFSQFTEEKDRHVCDL